MTTLICRDYGFECEYKIDGDEDKVVESFREHMETEHGIEYSKEAIMQFVLRKQ